MRGTVAAGAGRGRAIGVRAIFAERAEGVLTLRRGFDLDPADRVVVIEDVLTTGGSTRETMEVAKQRGAAVVAPHDAARLVHPAVSGQLGALGSLPPGEGGMNPDAGFTYMWHSHTERELVNNDVFPGGLMTMLIIEAPWVPIMP